MGRYEEAVRRIADFLAYRDVERLELSRVKEYFQGKTADAILVFGNDLPEVAEAGCRAWKEELAPWLLFCGGTGHSTELLRGRMEADERYRECRREGSEAELYVQIAVRIHKIPRDRIVLDTTSSNCGENAENGRKKLEERGIPMERLILMQDPLMQRRSCMSLKKALPESSRILSYAPFLPCKDAEAGIWGRERFLELLLGEVRRLRDDEKGYGPRGAGFIGHVDIPEAVEEAFEWLYETETGAHRRC